MANWNFFDSFSKGFQLKENQKQNKLMADYRQEMLDLQRLNSERDAKIAERNMSLKENQADFENKFKENYFDYQRQWNSDNLGYKYDALREEAKNNAGLLGEKVKMRELQEKIAYMNDRTRRYGIDKSFDEATIRAGASTDKQRAKDWSNSVAKFSGYMKEYEAAEGFGKDNWTGRSDTETESYSGWIRDVTTELAKMSELAGLGQIEGNPIYNEATTILEQVRAQVESGKMGFKNPNDIYGAVVKKYQEARDYYKLDKLDAKQEEALKAYLMYRDLEWQK